VRRQSRAAFDEFVRMHGDSLIRLAYALCGDRGRAEDASQEALTRLYLRWGRLDDPLPYARRCVVNAAKDHWRQSTRRERRELRAARWQNGDRGDPRQLRRHGQEPGQPRARQAPHGIAIRSHRSQYEGVSVNETQLIDERSAALDDATAPAARRRH